MKQEEKILTREVVKELGLDKVEVITSDMLEPRRLLADCSPNTQRIASATLLLPQPFGPTIAVIPSVKSIGVLSANDLNPTNSIFLKFTSLSCLFVYFLFF